MATDDANRCWADPELRAKFFDIDPADRPATGGSSTSTTWPACAQEDPEVFDDDRTGWRWARARRRRRRAADRPSRRARRPRRLPAAAARRRRRARVGGEDPRTPASELRDWPVDGTVGYEFLNDVAALFVDPAGEAALTTLWASCRATRGRSTRSRSRPSSSRRAATFAPRGRAAAARWRRRRADWQEALARAAGLPHLRRAVRAGVADEDREALAARLPARSRACCCSTSRRDGVRRRASSRRRRR